MANSLACCALRLAIGELPTPVLPSFPLGLDLFEHGLDIGLEALTAELVAPTINHTLQHFTLYEYCSW